MWEPPSRRAFPAGAVSRRPGRPAPTALPWTLFSVPRSSPPLLGAASSRGTPRTPRPAAACTHAGNPGPIRSRPDPRGCCTGPNHYLLIDTQGVPYTVLVDEESQRETGPDGASAQKKCYSCPVCSRVFEYMSYLQRHSITHSEVKPFECDTCGKAFKRASHLARHHSIHRAGGGRPHGCPLCPRRFREAGELAQHSRVHSGERPYQCPHCPRRFMEQNTLQKHTRWKHP
ncbi:zinc finger protein 581 isoform X2 [Odocoileus virginianus]|uniref:Zinc finger protein 581 isoform X2 n=1 Tax=Odocoileus virginianus TaxID=9874 RepID=A0ABM4GT28_ODOVR